MKEQPPVHQDVQTLLAHRLWYVSLGLFLIYAISVAAGILPLRLLDSAWQLQASRVLVDNGALPLLGLGLLHLASFLDPGNTPLRMRRSALANWAVLAMLGFLLLIPLQIGATLTSYASARQLQSNQLQAATNRLDLLLREISRAESVETIKARLVATQGMVPAGLDFSLPLPELKQRLDGSLRQARGLLVRQRQQNLDPAVIWRVIQESLRVSATAAALALAFAAGAQRRGTTGSPLLQLQDWTLSCLMGLVERRRNRLERLEERQRLQAEQRRLLEEREHDPPQPSRGVPPPLSELDYLERLRSGHEGEPPEDPSSSQRPQPPQPERRWPWNRPHEHERGYFEAIQHEPEQEQEADTDPKGARD